jgi:hypothetical protein
MSASSEFKRLGLPEDAVLPQPCSPCMDKLNNRPWHRTLAVTVGDVHIGVRGNTPATSDRLEEMLRALRAPHKDDEVAPNVSVSVGGEVGADARKLALVYRDHEIVARRRDQESLLLDLVELLDEFARLQTAEMPVVHACALLDREGSAFLLPPSAHGSLLTQLPRLEARELTMLSPRIHVLSKTGTHLTSRISDAGLSAVASSMGRNAWPDAPIKLWAVPGTGDGAFPLRPSEGLFGAFASVVTRVTLGAGPTLTMLGGAAEQIRWVGLPALSPAALSQAVVDLAD